MAKGMARMEESDKLFYKIGEVCRLTDTQPYVLRFWESEFPQLAPQKNSSGQRIYRSIDIDLIFRIKKLLYEEEFTIAGARKQIEDERLAPVPAAERGIDARPLVLQEIRSELEDLREMLDQPFEGLPESGEDPEPSS